MDWNHIDWNTVAHWAGIGVGGYVAATSLQWVISNVIMPLVQLGIGIVALKSVCRVAIKYIELKRVQALPAQPLPPTIEGTVYRSRLHDRLRR